MNLGNSNKSQLGLENKKNKYNVVMDVNIEDNSSHAKIVKHVNENSTVLDLGCSNGLIGEYLKKYKKCEVFGCDIQSDSLKIAKERKCYEQLLNVDLNTATDLGSAIKKEYFDFIILGDVLEHLINPENVINLAGKYLKPTGKIIVCIPNIAHSNIILNLMDDKFNYSDIGILDNTHFRFYTKNSFIDFINNVNKNSKNYDYICNYIDNVIVNDISDLRENKNFFQLLEKKDQNVLQNIFMIEKIPKTGKSLVNNYLDCYNNFNNNIEKDKIKNFEIINYEKTNNTILQKEKEDILSKNSELKKEIVKLQHELKSTKEIYNHKIYKLASLIRICFVKLIPYNSLRYKLVRLVYHFFKFILQIIMILMKKIMKLFLPKKLKSKIIRNLGYHSKLCNLINYKSYNSYEKEIICINDKNEIINQIFYLNKSIAVHLHLYYVDLADEFIAYLKNIPYAFDIFISISDKKNINYVKRKFKKIIKNWFITK